MFEIKIEPWDQVREFKITTLGATIELKEEEDFAEYQASEYERWEYVEYKFRIRKREGYREYLRRFIEVDVETLELKNLMGILSNFAEVYQRVLGLYRRGIEADAHLKWRDGGIEVAFGLYAAREGEEPEAKSMLKAIYGEST